MRPLLAASALLCAVALSVGASSANAKLPPGSVFETCGASGCTQTEALAIQVRIIEPTMEHGARPAPATDLAWRRVDLRLGPDRKGMSLGSVVRAFPVVYADGLLGVPRGNTYRWMNLAPRHVPAFAELASDVTPFPPENLAALTPGRVEKMLPGSKASAQNASPDGGGSQSWIFIALAAAAGVAGLLALRRVNRGRMQHEPV